MNLFCTIVYALFLFEYELSLASKINDFIPAYCKPYDPQINRVELSESGNTSSLVIRGYVYEGLQLPKEFHSCWLNVFAPRNFGITTTAKKIVLNDNDTIAFRSGSNPTRVWQSDDDTYEEIIALPSQFGNSNIYLNFTLGSGVSQHNAGIEIVFTAYKKNSDDCGSDFDCDNDRCIWSELQCNGFNNCGNNKDEEGCSGFGLLWIILIALLIILVIVFITLFLLYRRSNIRRRRR